MLDLDTVANIIERLEADRFATDPLRRVIVEARAGRKLAAQVRRMRDFQGQGVNPTLEPDEPGIYEIEGDLMGALADYERSLVNAEGSDE